MPPGSRVRRKFKYTGIFFIGIPNIFIYGFSDVPSIIMDFRMFILYRDFLMFLLYSNFLVFIALGIPYILFTTENPEGETGLRAPGSYHINIITRTGHACMHAHARSGPFGTPWTPSFGCGRRRPARWHGAGAGELEPQNHRII